MKYFTKEYRNALQNVGLVEGYEILEHENIDIDFLYKQKEDEFVEHERAIYDSPPIHENDLFSDIELVLEDILLSDFDEEGNEVNFRHPESFEEWEKYKEANHKRRLEEYENRETFDEKEARELFKINFDIAVKDKWQMPEWVYEKVDARLIALYYLPKDIYKELENLSKDSERIIEEIDQLEEKEPYNKLIPEEIIELLELHDSIYQSYMDNDTQGLLNDEFDYVIDNLKEQGLIKEDAGVEEDRDDLINIVGNIAQDIESLELQNNQGESFKVVNFTVVSNNEQGDRVFHNCSAYEDKAKIPETFNKGDFVKLFGQVRKNIDENGKEYTNVRILDSKLLKARSRGKGQEEKKESILGAIKKHKEDSKELQSYAKQAKDLLNELHAEER
jgi:single-stranded DNA-binding protein